MNDHDHGHGREYERDYEAPAVVDLGDVVDFTPGLRVRRHRRHEHRPLLLMVHPWPGAEFVALLPDTDHSRALQRAENLCRRVRGLAVAGQAGQPARTTVSVGLTLTGPDDDLTSALWRADAALYAAKAAGRDTVRTRAAGQQD